MVDIPSLAFMPGLLGPTVPLMWLPRALSSLTSGVCEAPEGEVV